MNIRLYCPDDCKEIMELFYQTVHTVNAQDYPQAQLDVWAPKHMDHIAWNNSLSAHHTVVVQQNGVIVGFGDMDATGYLDRLFVHKDHQRRGIATMIVTELECYAFKSKLHLISTDSSVTAKPFFEKLGYKVVAKQTVERAGQRLTNFAMKKHI